MHEQLGDENYANMKQLVVYVTLLQVSLNEFL